MSKYIYLSTEVIDPVSASIRFGTHSPWSHGGLFDTMRPKDACTLSAMLDGGVKWRKLPKKHLLLTAPGIEAAFAWALTQEGKKYDWSAIAGMVTNRDWRNETRWYCTELVAAAFEHAHSPLLNPYVVTWRITPRDILLSPYIMFVYAQGIKGLSLDLVHPYEPRELIRA